MPSSYRVTLTVGRLRPGVDPASVLPAAADAARARVQVEAYDVAVVRGQARITVRFLGAHDDEARQVAHLVGARAGELAQTGRPALTRRYGGRWYPIAGSTVLPDTGGPDE